MAAYDLEEQEQLATLKAWWENYGNLVTAIAVLVAISVVGWSVWNRRNAGQAKEASDAYVVVQEAAAKRDLRRVREAATLVAEKYPRTAYASFSAMLASQVLAEGGDLANAKLQLNWVIEKGRDPLLRDLARVRLAGVLLNSKDYEGALKQLAVKPADAFLPRFADTRGDVLLAQGKKNEAKAAYKEALALLEKQDAAGAKGGEGSALKPLIDYKIEGLGGAQ